ncbi:MAG TPA: NAD(P)H-dependent glycerol-3-phosphate dehydrogenase [Methylocella sp.]|nr:NAD(P)H-dependent glycerol-3-phosphate dehydrogenase [Methylocella sp.]
MPSHPCPRIGVLGAGAWGTALANLAAQPRANAEPRVLIWARDPAHVAEMTAAGANSRYLPGVPMRANVAPVADPAILTGVEFVLAAVPVQVMRQVLQIFAPYIGGDAPIILCAKGIEHATGKFLSEVARDVLPGNPRAILSGPSFAKEVAQGLPAAVTLAALDDSLAAAIAGRLAAPSFRLYSSSDVRGVEVGGAAKNVLAIASGIAAGRGLGASAAASLIARGFAELNRFGKAQGAMPETLMGLSGLGDLVLTCTSPLSRNYSLGFALGRGTTLADALEHSGLCEGASTCGVLLSLAKAKRIEMPVTAAVDAVLSEKITIDDAIAELLARPPKAEFVGEA